MAAQTITLESLKDMLEELVQGQKHMQATLDRHTKTLEDSQRRRHGLAPARIIDNRRPPDGELGLPFSQGVSPPAVLGRDQVMDAGALQAEPDLVVVPPTRCSSLGMGFDAGCNTAEVPPLLPQVAAAAIPASPEASWTSTSLSSAALKLSTPTPTRCSTKCFHTGTDVQKSVVDGTVLSRMPPVTAAPIGSDTCTQTLNGMVDEESSHVLFIDGPYDATPLEWPLQEHNKMWQLFGEIPPWGRSGFSPGQDGIKSIYHVFGKWSPWICCVFRPKRTQTSVFRSQFWIKRSLEEFSVFASSTLFSVTSIEQVNPGSLPINLARFNTCSMGWSTLYKCILNQDKVVVCICLNVTLGDVEFLVIWDGCTSSLVMKLFDKALPHVCTNALAHGLEAELRGVLEIINNGNSFSPGIVDISPDSGILLVPHSNRALINDIYEDDSVQALEIQYELQNFVSSISSNADRKHMMVQLLSNNITHSAATLWDPAIFAVHFVGHLNLLGSDGILCMFISAMRLCGRHGAYIQLALQEIVLFCCKSQLSISWGDMLAWLFSLLFAPGQCTCFSSFLI